MSECACEFEVFARIRSSARERTLAGKYAGVSVVTLLNGSVRLTYLAGSVIHRPPICVCTLASLNLSLGTPPCMFERVTLGRSMADALSPRLPSYQASSE